METVFSGHCRADSRTTVVQRNRSYAPATATGGDGQNWTFSYKSNMAPEGAANVNTYAAFLRLAIPIKPTKLEPKRHTVGHTSFHDKRI